MPCCNNHLFDGNMNEETQEHFWIIWIWYPFYSSNRNFWKCSLLKSTKMKGNAYMTSVCRIYSVLFRNSLRALINKHVPGHHDAYSSILLFMLYFQRCLFARGRWVLLLCRAQLSSALFFLSSSSHHPEFSWDWDIKGTVQPKNNNILSSFIHPLVAPNLWLTFFCPFHELIG